MSVRFASGLCVIGARAEIDRAMPALIEAGWWLIDRDRLCAKLRHTGYKAMHIPSCVVHNHKLRACLESVSDNYNTVSLETSALLFEAHHDFRGGQRLLSPAFDGQPADAIREVTPKAAREISEFGRPLELPKVEWLSLEAAEVLAHHRGSLSLPRLRQLDALTAKVLSRHIGWLHLDGLEDLPTKVAKELAWCRASLSMNGVRRVSPAAIKVLAAGQPHPQYGQLGYSTRSFADLRLDGLGDLSKALAQAIAKHPHNIILNGVRELDVYCARELAADRDGFLVLGGVLELDELVAEALGRTSAGLILSGLTVIAPRVAAGLAKTTGGLFLNGLTELSTAVAERLAEHRGHLGLWGVNIASDEALESLAMHDGPVVLGIGGGTTLLNGRRLAAPLQPIET